MGGGEPHSLTGLMASSSSMTCGADAGEDTRSRKWLLQRDERCAMLRRELTNEAEVGMQGRKSLVSSGANLNILVLLNDYKYIIIF